MSCFEEGRQSLSWLLNRKYSLLHLRSPHCLGLQLLRATGRTDVPLWYEAGAYKFDFADTKTLFVVQLILMG